MIVTKKFSFDLETRGISPLMYAVQGDVNTRKVEISLFSNGTAWEIPDGTVVAVAYRKPDGTGGLYDKLPSGESASAVSGNVVTVMLAPQVLTCAGNVVASVVFYSQDMADTLATFSFQIHVEKNPAAGEQISNNYYTLQNLEQVNAAYNDLLERVLALEHGGGNGLDATSSALLITILRNGVYSTDQSENITALENALVSGGGDVPDEPDEPDVPVVKTYTISNELVNVSSSNAATSVNENASYTATLTAADGYELDTVSVLMGGADVTADVYADGVISIPAVTGNVEIVASASVAETEAVLPEDGLLGFFDFRNKPAGSGDGYSGYYDAATVGDGRLYSWHATTAGNEYGWYMHGKTFCSGESFTAHKFGTEFTWITMSYSTQVHTSGGSADYLFPGNKGATLTPKYNTASGTSTASSVVLDKVAAGYHTTTMRVADSKLYVYVDAKLSAEYDGADIDGFVSWYDVFTSNQMYTAGAAQYYTAMAFYDRALTDAEVVEMHEYLKT